MSPNFNGEMKWRASTPPSPRPGNAEWNDGARDVDPFHNAASEHRTHRIDIGVDQMREFRRRL
jgi:hypothetical protein